MSFKPLARIISSATRPRNDGGNRTHKFQTACANYFLCNARRKKVMRLRISGFKPLARIISSATQRWLLLSPQGENVSNRLRELFPLQLKRDFKKRSKEARFKPLARIISSATYAQHGNLRPRIQKFQTACANYFLCNASKGVLYADNYMSAMSFKPLARIISSATSPRQCGWSDRHLVSNRLRELFPLQHSLT